VLGSLPVQVLGLETVSSIDEPQETGLTFAENARLKALYYARATGLWCLADDSGLVVDALGGAPGVHSARYAAENFPPHADRAARDAANTAKLLATLHAVPDERRTARFLCHLALADRDAILLESTGTVEGLIAGEPHGANGFGYDPVFLIPALRLTVAEIPEAEKNALSHRGQAVRRFAHLLADLLEAKQGTGYFSAAPE
jgi:XTP/dITP diphosphohydrolase